ncbi:MAG TPA: CaiB/BaiF CoA-transferase family protein [Woeseiaceae bacterium]|nr:CaiB/BaiF CoA-transferase family protein [Woeseiaceae bacterium]
MSGPLAGLRVLDMSRVLAGPWASQLLADYGAEVIKVERPECGDDTRQWGPPWLTDAAGRSTGESAYYLAANRNKLSVTVDIATAAGAGIVRELAARSDILLENFRVGTLARHGLDAGALRELNPALIYCSISAYGQSGPRASQSGYDAMIQASAGLMSLTGEADGPPLKTGVAVSDIMAGMYAVTAILAALHARRTSGRGQTIDVPLFDSQLAWLANQGMNYLVSGDVPDRHGNGHPNIVPYQAFATADGYLMLAVGNDRQFAAAASCLGAAELAADPRFATNADRVAHRESLVAMLAEAFRGRETGHWLAVLGEHGVPCGPINDLAAAFSDPQVAARGLLQTLPHPLAGEMRTVANPVRFSETAAELRSAPPLLGEHTEAVLRELLGYSDTRIGELRAAGTV